MYRPEPDLARHVDAGYCIRSLPLIDTDRVAPRPASPRLPVSTPLNPRFFCACTSPENTENPRYYHPVPFVLSLSGTMTGPSIQDRTSEFSAILGQAQKRLGSSKVGSQRQALLTDAQRRQANGSPSGAQDAKTGRSEFARRARDIGRGITGTTAKLQRLAECKCLHGIQAESEALQISNLEQWRSARPFLMTGP